MDLTPYVDRLRRELEIAADAGGEESRVLAARLTSPLESAVRLALLEALSAAADEITRDLAPGSVDLRLRGRDPAFVVTPPPVGETFHDVTGGAVGPVLPPPSASPPDGDDGGTSRITLRVPEHLKARIDQAAERTGLSVNGWLVRAITAAVDTKGSERRSGSGGEGQGGRHYTGWVR